MNKKINIQEYIESGILEQYALGLTTAEQNAEIAEVLKQYPELQKELTAIENGLELFAKQYSKPMPAYLKDRVLRGIEQEKNKLNLAKSDSGTTFLNYLLYLAIPVLIVSTLYFWKKNQDKAIEITEQKINYQQLELKFNRDSLALVDCNSQLNDLRTKDQHRILLKGTPKSPQSIAAIYYDTLAQKTFLDVLDLPPAPPQKQYQLWAIVSGKPVDLGVFDLVNKKSAFKEIKFVSKAEAFAITLEPYGGQASPSMDQMYVIGGI